ncbi:Gfo/Idh/MocA family oxidoreductase [Vibrio olivae]
MSKWTSYTSAHQISFILKWPKKALNANKHVICEKPLATKLEDALELQALAAEKLRYGRTFRLPLSPDGA